MSSVSPVSLLSLFVWFVLLSRVRTFDSFGSAESRVVTGKALPWSLKAVCSGHSMAHPVCVQGRPHSSSSEDPDKPALRRGRALSIPRREGMRFLGNCSHMQSPRTAPPTPGFPRQQAAYIL